MATSRSRRRLTAAPRSALWTAWTITRVSIFRALSTVSVPGASCRPAPSPTARAIRLESLRASGPEALAALLERLPDPPWDASIEPTDPLRTWLAASGFTAYGRTVTVVRSVEAFPRAAPLPGVMVGPYRNDYAGGLSRAEGAAMEGFGCYAEMGHPTGYERGEGMGAFAVARREDRVVGFCHAQSPEGWISWLGVVPEERRQGLGRLLVYEAAQAVAGARGTHLVGDVADRPEVSAFFRALGFREKGRRELLIRRTPSAA